ncbi:MAG: alpha-glucosidase/alpha-galactosidase [Robiginitomaculum sp.]|nr:MAG: alpha-glucosidase/alpha-galactosidase [Robiginitomaculum sp.]
MSFKITIIGAGSLSFTQRLIGDILRVSEFADCEFALTDINQRNLDAITQVITRMIAANNLPATVTATTDRRRALEGAKYVMSCVRVGGLEAFETDISIPLKYGIDQCVGDTLCAGGIMYGQRNIPVILEICKDIKEVAMRDALFMNYANPMAMNTWAANEYGDVKTVGLCHGVQHGGEQIAEILGGSTEELDYICIGINHQTWYTDIKFRGRKIEADELLAAFLAHPKFCQQEKVRLDVLKRFGYYSTESNGHLSEYLPWYRKRPSEIVDWIDMSDWIHGETGGYLRHTRAQRHWFETGFDDFLKKADLPFGNTPRSSEHASYIIEAIETGRIYRGHFNRPNNGIIRNLPRDAIIEAPGFVDHFGINMIEGHELPITCATSCTASISVQRMAVEAAVHGDPNLLKLAVLHDPLAGAVCSPGEIWTMVDEMIEAQLKWLPQYAQ